MVFPYVANADLETNLDVSSAPYAPEEAVVHAAQPYTNGLGAVAGMLFVFANRHHVTYHRISQ